MQENSDGRHSLMYFNIALHYHATIKVAPHEQRQIKKQDYYDRSPPSPVPDWRRHANGKGSRSGQ